MSESTAVVEAEFVEVLDDPGVDPEARSPQGAPCEACGSPVEPGDKFCPACGCPRQEQAPPAGAAPVEAEAIGAEAIGAEAIGAEAIGAEAIGAEAIGAEAIEAEAIEAEAIEDQQQHFRCETCGAEVATDPGQRSYVCPFCDSTYVIEFSPDKTGRQRPEFVIGFAVTSEEALDKFRHWLTANSWFRPGDLRQAQIEERLKGVYLPFWSFSMLAQSNWSARIGEYWYRTETYRTTDAKGKRVTRTRRVRETEWWPLAGRHHRYYNGYLVSGSRGLPQQEAERIKPFQLPALKRYQPYFLAGWFSEEYSVGRDDALRACQQEFYRCEQANVSAFLPGDTSRDLQINTTFRHVHSDLCLLPVYLLSYRYRDKLFRFMVNGQTGRIAGDKPLSWRRIGLFAAAVVAVIAVTVALLALFGAFAH